MLSFLIEGLFWASTHSLYLNDKISYRALLAICIQTRCVCCGVSVCMYREYFLGPTYFLVSVFIFVPIFAFTKLWSKADGPLLNWDSGFNHIKFLIYHHCWPIKNSDFIIYLNMWSPEQTLSNNLKTQLNISCWLIDKGETSWQLICNIYFDYIRIQILALLHLMIHDFKGRFCLFI